MYARGVPHRHSSTPASCTSCAARPRLPGVAWLDHRAHMVCCCAHLCFFCTQHVSLCQCGGQRASPLRPNRLCALHGPPSIALGGWSRRWRWSPSDAHLTGAAVGRPPLGCPHGCPAHRSGGRGARPARAVTDCRRGAPRPAGGAAAMGGRRPAPPSAVATTTEAATAMTGLAWKGRSSLARDAGGRAVQIPLHARPRRRGLPLSAGVRGHRRQHVAPAWADGAQVRRRSPSARSHAATSRGSTPRPQPRAAGWMLPVGGHGRSGRYSLADRPLPASN